MNSTIEGRPISPQPDWVSSRLDVLPDDELWSLVQFWAREAAQYRGAALGLGPLQEHRRTELDEAAWWCTQLAASTFRALASRPGRHYIPAATPGATHRTVVAVEVASPLRYWAVCDICGPVIDQWTNDADTARAWASTHAADGDSTGPGRRAHDE